MTCEGNRASAVGEDVIDEIGRASLLMRTRLISRVITGIHDEEFRPFGIGSPQFVLLVVIFTIEPATRADIARYHHQDRSTLTRNLQVMLLQGWIEELQDEAGRRGRPVVLTTAGKDLLRNAKPAWQVAQAQAKALLGKDGMIAVMDIASRIMNDPPKA
jgi:DNA-binding MarR family transcriptional regulator